MTRRHAPHPRPRDIPSFLRHVGPCVVTGAADDDPSGIATCTQAGAPFGTGVLWTVRLTIPFMIGIHHRGDPGHHDLALRVFWQAAQAAEALRPRAGDFAFTLFSLGIIATGLLAVPVRASSAACAVAEAFGWPEGLERHWREAKGFYAIIGIAKIVGTGLDFTPIDPMKALDWRAVVNGVVAVPIMVAMMVLSGNPAVMGSLTVARKTRLCGRGAALMMLAAVVMMVWDLLRRGGDP